MDLEKGVLKKILRQGLAADMPKEIVKYPQFVSLEKEGKGLFIPISIGKH